MSPHRIRILLWLSASCLIAATVAVWVWHIQNPVISETVKAPGRTEKQTADAVDSEPLDFSKLASKKLQRPLFDAKPTQAAKTAVKKPTRQPVAKPRLDIKLRGTVTTGDGIKAMLVTSANVSELLAPGDQLSAPNQDVVVHEVTVRGVVLKRGSHTYSLKSSK